MVPLNWDQGVTVEVGSKLRVRLRNSGIRTGYMNSALFSPPLSCLSLPPPSLYLLMSGRSKQDPSAASPTPAASILPGTRTSILTPFQVPTNHTLSPSGPTLAYACPGTATVQPHCLRAIWREGSLSLSLTPTDSLTHSLALYLSHSLT